MSHEPQVAEQRNVIVIRDGRAAGRAVGAGPHDGFAPGQPMNADVEEAADERAESRCNQVRTSVNHDACRFDLHVPTNPYVQQLNTYLY